MLQHSTGAASELFAAYKFMGRGHAVFFPLLTQSKADFIADVDGRLLRVQVKTGTLIQGKYLQVRLGGCGRPSYKPGDMDVLCIVYKERLWVIPAEVVGDKTTISFNPDKSDRKKHNDFDKYVWEK